MTRSSSQYKIRPLCGLTYLHKEYYHMGERLIK